MSDDLDWPRHRVLGARSVRFDLPPVVECAALPRNPSVLQIVRLLLNRRPRDRRATPRHPAFDLPIWFGSSRGADRLRANPAHLINISRGGALISVSEPPVRSQKIWIGLGEPGPERFLSAIVLAVSGSHRRGFRVRLRFNEPCPTAFFAAAVCMARPAKAKKAARTRSREDDARGSL